MTIRNAATPTTTYDLINWYFLPRQGLLCGDTLTCSNPTIYTYGQYKVLNQEKDTVLVQNNNKEITFNIDPSHQDRYFASK